MSNKWIALNTIKELSEDDVDQIVKIVGHGCREKTKMRLRSILTYGFSTIGDFGIYNRLHKEGDRWEYVAGQSYPDEIRTLRECILGRI